MSRRAKEIKHNGIRLNGTYGGKYYRVGWDDSNKTYYLKCDDAKIAYDTKLEDIAAQFVKYTEEEKTIKIKSNEIETPIDFDGYDFGGNNDASLETKSVLITEIIGEIDITWLNIFDEDLRDFIFKFHKVKYNKNEEKILQQETDIDGLYNSAENRYKDFAEPSIQWRAIELTREIINQKDSSFEPCLTYQLYGLREDRGYILYNKESIDFKRAILLSICDFENNINKDYGFNIPS